MSVKKYSVFSNCAIHQEPGEGVPGCRDKGGARQGGKAGGRALYFSLALYFSRILYSVFSIALYFAIALYFSMLCISVFLQVAVLSQSTGRVASSSEQYGAVQQEARVATAIEVMLLQDIWIFSNFLTFCLILKKILR